MYPRYSDVDKKELADCKKGIKKCRYNLRHPNPDDATPLLNNRICREYLDKYKFVIKDIRRRHREEIKMYFQDIFVNLKRRLRFRR